jgi:hypothetical protein
VAWTYSGDPASSPRDELRFTIQDTDTSLQLLTDGELDWLLSQWMERFDSITYVASIAAGVIARKFTGIVSVSSDGVSVSTADLAARYRDMAAALRDEYKAHQVGAPVDIANLMIGSAPDWSIRPLRFGVGLHDNYAAGSQDFGGQTYDPYSDGNSDGINQEWGGR